MQTVVFGSPGKARKLILYAHGDYQERKHIVRHCDRFRREARDRQALVVCGYRSNTLTPNRQERRGRKDDVVRQTQLLNWAIRMQTRMMDRIAGTSCERRQQAPWSNSYRQIPQGLEMQTS